MSLDYIIPRATPAAPANTPKWGVTSETGRLTDVLLCPPAHLAPVPCCSVTRESLREGFSTSPPEALAQHRALERTLAEHGVACHMLSPHHALADMCFTRDSSFMTPWGLLGLKPAADHRRAETDLVMAAARAWGVDILGRIERGTVEGGDIVILRPGLVVIGCSGERTSEAGADEVACRFRAKGWEAIIYRFDPHFLHLDTQLCMAAPGLALACTAVLEDRFLARLNAEGLRLIDVSYKEARRLGCNVLSLGGGVVLSSAENTRVNRRLRRERLTVVPLAIDQFTRCGGGVHCLTMPLARAY